MATKHSLDAGYYPKPRLVASASSPGHPVVDIVFRGATLRKTLSVPALPTVERPPVERPTSYPVLGERYQLIGELGRGGMGVVVQTFDRLLHRHVAMKMLSEELDQNPEAHALFLAEARVQARMSHPLLASVYDVLEVDGHALIVMELVRGDNVQELIDSGAIDPATAAMIGAELGEVIAYLHEAKFVHRDIKPGNLMLTPQRHVKLLDFGLARRFDRFMRRESSVRGTPAYMSPEQVSGAPLSSASDIYQIGVTLFELFSGRLPFDSGEMAIAHLYTTPPTLAELRPELPRSLSELVDACLAKEPSSRPARAAEIAKFLRGLELEPRATRPTQASPRVRIPSTALPPASGEPPPVDRGTTSSQADEQLEQLLEAGLEAILDKNLSRAASLFASAAAIAPDDPRVRAKLDRLAELGFDVRG